MKRRKVDNQMERSLLTALIVSKEFLGQAYQVLRAELGNLARDAPFFHLIVDWCLAYYEEYRDAPKARIETLYYGWTQSEPDEELQESVSDLLEDISNEYETTDDINVAFLLDVLSKFLSKKKLNSLQEELDGSLSRGDTQAAIEAVTNYRTIELGESAGFSLNDDKIWDQAFAEASSPLIDLPGAAGLFLGKALTRDAFLAVLSPEKRGKTWWLLEFAIRGVFARKKVAFFQVGDLSQGQIVMRMGVRLAGVPQYREDCGRILIPKKIERDEDEELGVRVGYNREKRKKCLTKKIAKIARTNFFRSCGIPPTKDYLMTSVHANSSINIKGIDSILDRWAIEKGFIADIILIDYADILAPEEVKKDGRDMINDTWKAMRRLSQERHALVITATQANAASYDAHLMTMKNFSEDKRKFAHVTGMFGLNQTPEEKEAQIIRLNWLVLRNASYNPKRVLWTGNCFTIGRALTCSAL